MAGPGRCGPPRPVAPPCPPRSPTAGPAQGRTGKGPALGCRATPSAAFRSWNCLSADLTRSGRRPLPRGRGAYSSPGSADVRRKDARRWGWAVMSMRPRGPPWTQRPVPLFARRWYGRATCWRHEGVCRRARSCCTGAGGGLADLWSSARQGQGRVPAGWWRRRPAHACASGAAWRRHECLDETRRRLSSSSRCGRRRRHRRQRRLLVLRAPRAPCADTAAGYGRLVRAAHLRRQARPVCAKAARRP